MPATNEVERLLTTESFVLFATSTALPALMADGMLSRRSIGTDGDP